MDKSKAAVYVLVFLLWAVSFAILFRVIDWQKISSPFFTGWGVFAILNAIIAKHKRGSYAGWFLLTLLFGPFATLLLLLISKKAKLNER